ncbi:hypothetical protein P691DRAFT_379035 [Macrolepiota fuliginosa MF-IS2]|uniref:Uncharacterized protein n=1 Tax=Macrolepiota fuliginosa MF-IS2 TaxID=1400762 RepID=A0A9P5XI02_9AGAR|nr:hypothetical protein P691DRAFT_379035 [Macrolepiota fuliginosa MF-IS2]
MSVISLGIANALVLLRVASLWDKRPIIIWSLAAGFIVSLGITTSMLIASIVELADSFEFEFSMCVLTKATPKFVVACAAPMIHEIIVLIATWWNALSMPRQADMPLRDALHRDGVTFFMALSVLRVLNLSFAATNRPELFLMTVFFVWPMTTLILNRSLLRLQHAENLQLILNGMINEESPRHSRSSQPSSSDSSIYDHFGTGQRWPNSKARDGEQINMTRFGY